MDTMTDHRDNELHGARPPKSIFAYVGSIIMLGFRVLAHLELAKLISFVTEY